MDDNERLARALGLTLVHGWAQWIEGELLLSIEEPDKAFGTYDAEPAWLIVDGDKLRLVPPYTTSLVACAEAEAEIARRGLGEQYAVALCAALSVEISHINNYDDTVVIGSESELFAITTAPPEARVRALLKVLEAV